MATSETVRLCWRADPNASDYVATPPLTTFNEFAHELHRFCARKTEGGGVFDVHLRTSSGLRITQVKLPVEQQEKMITITDWALSMLFARTGFLFEDEASKNNPDAFFDALIVAFSQLPGIPKVSPN